MSTPKSIIGRLMVIVYGFLGIILLKVYDKNKKNPDSTIALVRLRI